MARDDKREIFRTLYDSTAETGEALEKAVNTVTDPSGLNGLIGFSFINSSGNVVLPQLTSAGAIVVDVNGGTRVQAQGEDENGSKVAFVDVATLTLTASTVYEQIEARGSCRRDSLWELVGIEDAEGTPVETILEKGISGSGQFTIRMGDSKLSYTAGTTGVLQILLRAQQFDAASACAGTITAMQQ